MLHKEWEAGFATDDMGEIQETMRRTLPVLEGMQALLDFNLDALVAASGMWVAAYADAIRAYREVAGAWLLGDQSAADEEMSDANTAWAIAIAGLNARRG